MNFNWFEIIYLQVLHFLRQFDIFLWDPGFVVGDVDDGTIQFFNFHVKLGYMHFEFLHSFYWHQFFFRHIVQLGEEFVYLLLEFRFFLVSSANIANNVLVEFCQAQTNFCRNLIFYFFEQRCLYLSMECLYYICTYYILYHYIFRQRSLSNLFPSNFLRYFYIYINHFKPGEIQRNCTRCHR